MKKNSNYIMGFNQMSDWTDQEYQDMLGVFILDNTNPAQYKKQQDKEALEQASKGQKQRNII
jgi:hypothetical protein